jgi:F0F1-type ATP synthase membrane subunit b/b'
VSTTPSYPVPEPQGPNWKTPLVAGALIALAAANVFLYVQLDRTRTDIAKMRESILTEVTNLRDASSVSVQSQKQRIENLKAELEEARRQANASASQGKAEAIARAEQLAKRLEVEQAKAHQQVTSEISRVKQDTKAANTRIGEVSADVGAVRTDLGSTKSDLEKAVGDLKRMNGDMGVQSGLIATNAQELAALRRLGERNYFEFKLGKSKQPQRVADITLLLKKTDAKRNKYTVEVMADDKRVEKKDKNVNEPVQFYTSKARIPYELVVNTVGKDLISGYLATPKETVAR